MSDEKKETGVPLSLDRLREEIADGPIVDGHIVLELHPPAWRVGEADNVEQAVALVRTLWRMYDDVTGVCVQHDGTVKVEMVVRKGATTDFDRQQRIMQQMANEALFENDRLTEPERRKDGWFCSGCGGTVSLRPSQGRRVYHACGGVFRAGDRDLAMRDAHKKEFWEDNRVHLCPRCGDEGEAAVVCRNGHGPFIGGGK